MTKAIGDWSPIDFGNGRILELDFTDALSDGDSVASLTGWSCVVASSSTTPDPTPANRILAAPSLVGNKTQQMFMALPAGVAPIVYLVSAKILTTNGEPMSGWSYLPVIPAGGCYNGC